MALVARLQKTVPEQTNADITHNLETLQFESALTEEEKQMLRLRAISHATTVSACAQATFLVSILHEARQLKKQIKSPQKRTAKILQDQEPRDPLKVGIIGCGRLGSQLAHCLLTYGNVGPKDMKISTRRPETLEYLQNKGTDCFYDNIKLVSTSHIIFLCVLPSNIPSVIEEIKDHVPKHSIVYSLASSYTIKKLKQLLIGSSILRPEYTWDSESEVNTWDYSVNISTALEDPVVVEKTCPLGYRQSECVVKINEKFAELMIFAFMNQCAHLRLNKTETLDMLHMVVFDQVEEDRLKEEDFIKKTEDSTGLFPRFDLARISEIKTSVLRRITQSEPLRKGFVKKYLQIFDNYVQQKAYNQMYGET
ncbi:hypothetical protein KUTeg_014187 [Tegillarca granosa]|uniref:Pyrroline-5-carboxylate reductase catalytic N-terminal domain-containing protein n=1 Tax=Tegillarca granosa TaxID=220873 RepID=A0ABQ9F1B3_TEGGR|nr:hypothetical protein KUTeg_014187 [Tegillarca granosa]